MAENRRTIQYYDNNSEEFARNVNMANIAPTYEHFLKYVPAGGTIVDIGCGSGRDMKHFKDLGYKPCGIDASEGMCKMATEYSGCPVECTDALKWSPKDRYDAFWANASLLHLKQEEIVRFLRTKSEFLKPGGILYFSMKAGIAKGYDEKGRYFTPFSESIVESVLEDGKLELAERWTENDSLNRGGFHWEAIILRRL